MTRVALALALLIAAEGATPGQVTRSQLKPTTLVRTKVAATAIIQPVRCDSNQSVYIRRHKSNGVVRISKDGQSVTDFSLDSANLVNLSFLDFAVDSRGEVYFLVEAPEPQVIVFDKDGNFKKKLILNAEVWPRQLAVFQTGEIVVLGRTRPKSGAEPLPFAGIFNASGQLIRRLDFPAGEPDPSAGGSKTSEKQSEPKQSEPMMRADWLSLSTAEAGDDGNVYLSRPGPNGPVIILSPSGEVSRILRPQGPKNALITSVKARGGRVAVLFVTSGAEPLSTGLVQVLDSSADGEIVGEYNLPAQLGLAFACFSPGEFGFLRGGQVLEIVAAEPE